MFGRKRIAVVSGLVGGIAAACVGVTPAHAAVGPGKCTRDILGDVSCVQRIRGQVPAGGAIPHQEMCQSVQPTTVPSFLSAGTQQLESEVSCSPTGVGTSAPVRDERESPDMPR
ncbi:hypothetical protein AB0L59_02330 [Streptomyces sp. NPDC052109]|uniref:hypothetical protein n=1 Tax=Streptomyces sp. NPDC052109 TaxID=3155527 RepID=UPI00341A5500